MTPELALAASAREWPDRLHRHLLDHGGGKVVARVMGPDQVAATSFDVLLIDDISSFLTPRLVSVVGQSGREVIGVFDPADGPDAKRRLLDCGVTDVIESDASPDEFLRAVGETMSHRVRVIPADMPPPERGRSMAVMGVCDGVGATEVAVGLAVELSTRLSTTLVDLDPVWPSIAPRLDLPLYPNLRTAVDRALHEPDSVPEACHRLRSLLVIAGVADQASASPVSHTEVAMLLDLLASAADVLIADLGSSMGTLGGVVSRFDSVALVGAGSPVGVTRLLKALDRLLGTVDAGSVVVVVNKVPGGRYHHSEVEAELASAYPEISSLLIPHDRRVEDSTWQGTVSGRGRFARSLRRMTDLIEESVAS